VAARDAIGRGGGRRAYDGWPWHLPRNQASVIAAYGRDRWFERNLAGLQDYTRILLASGCDPTMARMTFDRDYRSRDLGLRLQSQALCSQLRKFRNEFYIDCDLWSA
jgi:hypothetical protein